MEQIRLEIIPAARRSLRTRLLALEYHGDHPRGTVQHHSTGRARRKPGTVTTRHDAAALAAISQRSPGRLPLITSRGPATLRFWRKALPSSKARSSIRDSTMRISNRTFPEHCARGLDDSLALGAHGLPLIGTGD